MRIYFLGDSHGQALGPALASRIATPFSYEAFAGYSTARATAAARIPTDARIAIVELGGNDFGDASAARAELVRKLVDAGVERIYWFGPAQADPPDVDRRHLQQRDAQRVQLPDLGVRWFDSRPLAPPEEHRDDGVHFTKAGYQAWADGIADTLLEDARRATASARSWPAALLAAAAVAAVGIAGWLVSRAGRRSPRRRP